MVKGTRNKPLEVQLNDAIKKGLASLGESGATSTVFFLQARGNFKIEEAPSRPREFCEALRSIFGVGSATLLRTILSNLKQVQPNGHSDAKQIEELLKVFQQSIDSVETGVE